MSLAQVNPNPFANNNGEIPPKGQYTGPLFQLNYRYPTTLKAPPANPLWRQALRGHSLSRQNAIAYAYALKAYVSNDMKKLILDYPHWNAQQAGWFNEPWLGGIRESTHGAYHGSDFPATTFPKSGLTKGGMSTYVLTFYDSTAAYTLHQVWGTDAQNPKLTNSSGQFAEGAVIVKLAVTTALEKDWPVMAGAAQWPLYIPAAMAPDTAAPSVRNTSVMQLDIIVKDAITAPKTGWVFTTLVYDAKAPGINAWDKMVPLGAMWGNDPEINSTKYPNALLTENVINPKAPLYATETLGWGGRLSGPNDAAVVAPAIITDGQGGTGGLEVPAVAASSCMSCHSPAQYPMKSFLLPIPTPTDTPRNRQGALVLNVPGSMPWMKWFQDRPGNVSMDSGTTPLDYDMVFAFKSLPAWALAKQGKDVLAPFSVTKVLRDVPRPVRAVNGRYNGL